MSIHLDQFDDPDASRMVSARVAHPNEDAIERALQGESSCSDLLQRITAARGAINGLMAEVLEEHVREYLIPQANLPEETREDAGEELIEIIHSYLT